MGEEVTEMNETVVYNVFHLDAYGYLVLAYFFLGGGGGGAFLASAFSTLFGGERYKNIARVGAVISVVLVSIGGVFLVFDLEQPQRIFYLFFKFNKTSPISWGGIILSLFFLCSLFYLYFLLIQKNEKMARLFGGIGIVIAILVMSYTGLLISMARARPLWHSAIMPPLFLISGGISGLACILLVVNLLDKYRPDDDVLKFLRIAMVILILLDIFFLSDMYVLYVGIAEAQEVALLLLTGKFAFTFWVVELLIGSIAPVLILSMKRYAHKRQWQILAAVLSMIGVFTMRYIIIVVGQYLPLS